MAGQRDTALLDTVRCRQVQRIKPAWARELIDNRRRCLNLRGGETMARAWPACAEEYTGVVMTPVREAITAR